MDRARPVPHPLGVSDARPPHVPPLRGPLDRDGYVEAVGERCALFGTERGPFEWWAWPLEVASELRLTLHLPGTAAPIALEALRGECEVTPGGFTLVHRGVDFALRQELVCDPERAVLLWLLELEGDRELEAELACVCDLRPMWPAGLGGQLGLRDPVTGALTLTEETGRYAAFLGAVGGRVREAPDGRGLPRRPVRLAARLKPGEPQPIVFAATERPARPLTRDSRVGRGQAAAGTATARGVVDDARALWLEAGEGWRAVRERARAAWRTLDARTVRLRCGDADAERSFAWSQAVADRSWVRVRGLGRAQVAGLAPSRGGDRPGFGWVFDTDALVAARVLGGLGHFTPAARSLWSTASRQRADGKLAHEVVLSADLCDWFERYPYAYYRGVSAVQFAVALNRCVSASGDDALGRALLPHLAKALEWLWSTRGPEGLATTSRAGLGAIQSGPLSEEIEVDAYLHGGLYNALRAGADLAERLGAAERAALWSERADAAGEAFESLWDEEVGRYAFAVTRDGRHLTGRAGLLGAALAGGLGRDDRAARAALELCHPELATDWGVRLLGEREPHFHPDNYNSGAVFPLITAQAALACYRVGRTAAGHLLLATLIELEGLGGRGLVEEHLPGDRARLSPRRVPRHLGSSMAVLAALVDGALGYCATAGVDGAPDRVTLRVQHPLPWRELTLEGLRVGRRTFALRVARRSVRGDGEARTELSVTVTPTGTPTGPGADPEESALELHVAAVLPAHSTVVGALAGDGAALDFTVRELPGGAEELIAAGTPAGATTLTFRQGPHLAFPPPALVREATSVGVRPIAATADEHGATLAVAGPPGAVVELGLTSDRAFTLRGAERARRADGSECATLRLPDEADGRHARATVVLGLE